MKLFKDTTCTLCTPPAPLQRGAAPLGRPVHKVVGSPNSVLTRKFLEFAAVERCFEPVGHRPVEEVVEPGNAMLMVICSAMLHGLFYLLVWSRDSLQLSAGKCEKS